MTRQKFCLPFAPSGERRARDANLSGGTKHPGKNDRPDKSRGKWKNAHIAHTKSQPTKKVIRFFS